MLGFVDLSAQKSDKEKVQGIIETFFEGFHKQDSLIIKQTVMTGIILQTITKDNEGHDYVKFERFSNFLGSIVGIPKNIKFQETIKSYAIQVDGKMAHAWIPYEFKVNDTLSHCGVNSFQLFKEGEDWKIIYLIDTRRKIGCE